jgi:predicted O-methyltransferase YrrM
MSGLVRRIRHLLGRSPRQKSSRPLVHTLFENRPLLNALAYRWSDRAIDRRKAAECDLDDVLATVLDRDPGWPPYRLRALQLRPEFETFVRFLADQRPRTVLEIGLFLGGTLYVWARGVGSTERLVSVDQPVWTDRTHSRRSELYPTFSETAEIDVVYGNSHSKRTASEIADRFEESVDFLFVDGDHTYEGVKEDFETYRQLVGDGGIVAFHDIKRHAVDRDEKRARLRQVDDLEDRHVSVGASEWGVSEFWDDVKTEYDTREFVTHPKQMGAGIGVILL